MEIQNSNPTILNAADLPSRRRVAEELFSSDYDEFSQDDYDDDSVEEPIDEQEIYGEKEIK